jgi:hypothetical protein
MTGHIHSGFRHEVQIFPTRFARLFLECARLGVVIAFFGWIVALIIAVTP